MNAAAASCADWLDQQFFDRLEKLESHHQRIQSEHDAVRRGLERLNADEVAELKAAWHRYCEVIAELDHTTAEIEALRAHAL